MADTAPTARQSILDVEDVSPYAFYDEVLADRRPVRDPRLGVWLVPTYDAVTRVMKEEDVFSFFPPGEGEDKPHDESLIRVHGGSLRRLVFLRGAEHRALHRWWLSVFSPEQVERWRETLIRELVDATFARIEHRGRAELWADVAQRIPVRAICAVMNLPWEDDEFVTRVSAIIDVAGEYFNHRPNPGPELTRRAGDAVDEFYRMLEPMILARRDAGGDDVVAQLWRQGAEIFDDWNERDVFAQLHNMFLGGRDTTTLGIANALHRLLTTSGMVERLREHPDLIKGFVEETLRLDPPAQYRARYTATDVQVGDSVIRSGQLVLPLLAAANRDPAKFEAPEEARPERRSAHLAFGYGPRRCVGANLARAEIQEVVSVVVERFPDMKLDPDAEAPRFPGRMLRAHYPLHVTFTARVRTSA